MFYKYINIELNIELNNISSLYIEIRQFQFIIVHLFSKCSTIDDKSYISRSSILGLHTRFVRVACSNIS